MLDVTTVEAYMLDREKIRLPEDARHASCGVRLNGTPSDWIKPGQTQYNSWIG